MKENEMIFGIRAIIEAIESDKEIDKIILKKDLQSELSHELFEVLRSHPLIQVQRVPLERINKYTRKNHQGAIAFISSTHYQRVEDLVQNIFEEGKDPFFIILDGVTDVRNFGAIARTCECAGVDAIVIPFRGSVSVGADAIKTSAGALHTLPVCKEKNLVQTVKYLKASGVRVVAATEKGDKVYTDTNLTGPLAIVMGAEDTGVSPEIIRLCDDLVKIPINGKISSLNVSVAAGVMIYESIRQRQK
ncbi:MAG: 23S rRNA (guanosine(2251)-2'-O)-methyltransferase RlmB [Paludibacteraceae bacterium]|jgi:23S rRNA (guanosine2251-2'-O)-methyltransferase|nr:23S rRNA (guanosine(2251)-2'-O)-methyltransferase RlmB [Paludibacteraceae bacterium]MDD5996036.1 23S rRNA (guanosine(2251)-2'-O)-methyltransferase RlmB [Bacteroidales bacterium]MBP5526202.1 23S rRNA (guanosine(2251)-2'-O)-methyltransferase RlmB [Paludibacteraceae bacterium]MBQ8018853.1 23S rRNA (guanosine(2251)-2'-O)-methyltransferase RlmB [Paludibacteraceae bacterium]MBR6111791.1 23S rRNA (guanosine(2251)-2'-O)-methyltransferase RlmB [Paludibacteraceae bacterium]